MAALILLFLVMAVALQEQYHVSAAVSSSDIKAIQTYIDSSQALPVASKTAASSALSALEANKNNCQARWQNCVKLFNVVAYHGQNLGRNAATSAVIKILNADLQNALKRGKSGGFSKPPPSKKGKPLLDRASQSLATDLSALDSQLKQWPGGSLPASKVTATLSKITPECEAVGWDKCC